MGDGVKHLAEVRQNDNTLLFSIELLISLQVVIMLVMHDLSLIKSW